jgi:hypothetical protein
MGIVRDQLKVEKYFRQQFCISLAVTIPSVLHAHLELRLPQQVSMRLQKEETQSYTIATKKMCKIFLALNWIFQLYQRCLTLCGS